MGGRNDEPLEAEDYDIATPPTKHMKAILAGTLHTPLEEIRDGAVLIDGPRIAQVGPRDQIEIPAGAEVIDHRDRIVIPGMIDQHIHGAAGHDLMEGTPEAATAVGGFLARHGTTAFVATTVTAPFEVIRNSTRALAKLVRASRNGTGPFEGTDCAQPIGIHFEGPFLNVARRGAHPARDLQPPSVTMLEQLLEAAGDAASILTLAPELDGAMEMLALARRLGLRTGIGHSNATYEEAERAIDSGATHATHTYNAMRAFSHRDPGIIGAVLTDDRVLAELICDGIHVDPAAVRLLMKAKGPRGVILVTDSASGASMPDGLYRVGELSVHLSRGVLRTAEGDLAGSTLTLDTALRNLMRFSGLDFRTCLPCATLNVARLLGLEKRIGAIAPGAQADLAVLGTDYAVTQTYVRGRPVV